MWNAQMQGESFGPRPPTVWRRFWRNPHVKCELGAVCYLAFAAGAVLLGLRIAPAVCILIAVAMIGADLYDLRHPRH